MQPEPDLAEPDVPEADATAPSEDGPEAGGGDPTAAWWVYVLCSADGRRTYVGSTRDMDRRIQQHNGALPGGARATRAGRPWQVGRLLGPFASRGDALRAEIELKRRRGARRLDGA